MVQMAFAPAADNREYAYRAVGADNRLRGAGRLLVPYAYGGSGRSYIVRNARTCASACAQG